MILDVIMKVLGVLILMGVSGLCLYAVVTIAMAINEIVKDWGLTK